MYCTTVADDGLSPELSACGKFAACVLKHVGYCKSHELVLFFRPMIQIQPTNYLRTFRRRSALTQEELSYLLGERTGAKVSRYERDLREPNLENLYRLEYIFHKNLAGLYPGLDKRLAPDISKRACNLKKKITDKKENSDQTNRKIDFLSPLCNQDQEPSSRFFYGPEYGTFQMVSQSFFKPGKPDWAGTNRTLAIDPINRGFGFAIMEQNPDLLLEWGVANCRDYMKADCLDRISKLIEYFSPSDLLVENSCPIPRSRCHKLRRFMSKVKALARKHRLTVHIIPSSTLRAYFEAQGANNQEERAQIVAHLFPELGYRVPPHRDIWMTEDYWMPVFDAMGLIVTFLKNRKLKP